MPRSLHSKPLEIPLFLSPTLHIITELQACTHHLLGAMNSFSHTWRVLLSETSLHLFNNNFREKKMHFTSKGPKSPLTRIYNLISLSKCVDHRKQTSLRFNCIYFSSPPVVKNLVQKQCKLTKNQRLSITSGGEKCVLKTNEKFYL